MFLFLSNPNEKISYFLSLSFEAESALVQTRSSCCCVRIRERETRFDVVAIILYLFFIFFFFFLLLSDDKEETVLFCFVLFPFVVLFFFDFSWHMKEVSENTKGRKRMKKSRRLFLFSCGKTNASHFQAHNEKHVFFSLHAIGVSRHVGSYHVHKQ